MGASCCGWKKVSVWSLLQVCPHIIIDIREGLVLNRCASRISVRSALRANFEQTAPPPLREGSPPDSGGEWLDQLCTSMRIHILLVFTERCLTWPGGKAFSDNFVRHYVSLRSSRHSRPVDSW